MARGLPGWEPAQGVNANPLEWIRTQDGWERSLVLLPPSREQGLVHPLVVAGLQFLGSLLVLLAFPRSARQPASHPRPGIVERPILVLRTRGNLLSGQS